MANIQPVATMAFFLKQGVKRNAHRFCDYPVIDRIWAAADSLLKRSKLIVDRPRGSKHPRYPEVEYPLDYGYLEYTSSGDRSGIDVWVGSLQTGSVTALLCTIDLAKSDAEVKFLVDCTPEEEEIIMTFHNVGDQSATIVRRHSA